MLNRKMGYEETRSAQSQDVHAGSSNTCMAIHLCGMIDFSLLTKCLQCMYQKHPLLRCAYYSDEADNYFLREEVKFADVAINHEIVDSSEQQWQVTWKQRLEAHVEHCYQPHSPMWHVTLLSSTQHDQLCILFAAHHAIIDGASQQNLIREIAGYYKKLQQGEVIDIVSLKLPECMANSFPDFITWDELMSNQEREHQISKDIPRLPYHHFVSAKHARVKVLICDFSVEQMQQLIDRSRQQQVKVTALFCAALLLAQHQVLQINGFALGVAIDMRDYCQPPIAKDVVGNFAVGTCCYFQDITTAHSVWELAEQYQRCFDDSFTWLSKPPKEVRAATMMAQCRALSDDSVRHTFTAGGGFSNWRYVEFPEKIGDAEFRGVHRTVNKRDGIGLFSYNVASMKQGICGTFNYVEPLFDGEMIAEVVHCFRQILLETVC